MSEREVFVRTAKHSDVGDLVRISSKFRAELAEFQPQFWRVAEGADEKQKGFFEFVVTQEKMVVLVAERAKCVCGFLMAAFVPAPPVYDPGGLTCIVDDFGVSDANDWSEIGDLMLKHLAEQAEGKGCSQLVVICPHLHQGKRNLLDGSGFSIASEWWVRGL